MRILYYILVGLGALASAGYISDWVAGDFHGPGQLFFSLILLIGGLVGLDFMKREWRYHFRFVLGLMVSWISFLLAVTEISESPAWRPSVTEFAFLAVSLILGVFLIVSSIVRERSRTGIGSDGE